MQMLVWSNYTRAVANGLRGIGGENALDRALRACVISHNGWRCGGGEPRDDGVVCDGGEPLPDAQSEGFWWGSGVSDELVGVVIATVLQVPWQYPKELRTNGTR